MDDEDSPRPTEALIHQAEAMVKSLMDERPDIVRLLKYMNLYYMIECFMVKAWIAGHEEINNG